MQTPFEIDSLHYEDLENKKHLSIFDDNEAYDMLILRLPVIEEMHELEIISFGFIISQDTSYFFNPSTKTLEPLSGRFEGPYRMIDKKLDRLLKAFDLYEEQISEMEEGLYSDGEMEHFIVRWLKFKRDILRFERIISRSMRVLKDMIGHYESVGSFPENHYYDLHEHLERLHRSIGLQQAKLDYLYSFHNTRTNERMNRLIFFLTIISAIFLPLNLFVGFFGMNTGGLPFTENKLGTLFVMSAMVVLVAITAWLVVLWRKRIELSES